MAVTYMIHHRGDVSREGEKKKKSALSASHCRRRRRGKMMQNASRHPSKSHNLPLSGDNGFCSFANGVLLAGSFLAVTQISLIATSPKCHLLVVLQNLTHKYLFLAYFHQKFT